MTPHQTSNLTQATTNERSYRNTNITKTIKQIILAEDEEEQGEDNTENKEDSKNFGQGTVESD